MRELYELSIDKFTIPFCVIFSVRKLFWDGCLLGSELSGAGAGGNARITLFKSSSILCIEIECRDGWEEVVEMTNKSKVEIGSACDSLENVLFNLISCGYRLRNFQFKLNAKTASLPEYIWNESLELFSEEKTFVAKQTFGEAASEVKENFKRN